MVIVTKIETLEVSDTWQAEIQSLQDKVPVSVEGSVDYKNLQYMTEVVQGRRFINTREGIDIVIAYGSEAEKVLGITYDSFDNLQKLKDAAETACFEAKKKLEQLIKKRKDFDFLYYLKHGNFPEY